jgi:hypothetical protein
LGLAAERANARPVNSISPKGARALPRHETMSMPDPKKSSPMRRAPLYALALVAYLASTIPVGLFLYSLKSAAGVDLFSHGGFHAYMQCLGNSFPLRTADVREDQAPR